MPLPTTDEQLITDDIAGGRTLSDLYDLLDLMSIELQAIRDRADQGTLPPAARLVNEFFMRSDLDNGAGVPGSVYGVHFQIDSGAPDFPPALLPVHQHPLWVAPPVSITWTQFLTTLT